jgi:signal transduction histidine kinase
MSIRSKAYWFLVTCAGLASLAYHLAAFKTDDPYRFAWYLVAALFVSSMKVGLPGVTGTLSVLFLFVFIGVIQLRLPETLVIGLAATFVQSLWRARKPKLIHLGFNIASLAIASTATYYIYTPLKALKLDILDLLPLAAAVLVFFAANTLIVSVIMALTENKPILRTWKAGSFWSFPYYIAGGCVAGLFSYLTRLGGWQISILILPVAYFTYRSYRLYLDNLNETRSHAKEMQAAAQQLNAVLESTNDCVLAIGTEGRITYANQRARTRVFGGSEAVGVLLWERFPKLVEDGFKDHFGTALTNKTPVETEEFFPELNAWFEIHAYPSNDGIVLYMQEVTKQRELVQQLEQARKMEAVGRLAGGVAHDFNNLLTVILGYGRVLEELLESNHPAQATLAEILVAGERAAALTGRLLAFSRKQIQHPEVLDLNAVVSGMEGMVRRLIGEDIRISVSLDAAAGKIRADQNQIEQVIMNLAANARDAMPGGGEFRIATRGITIESASPDAVEYQTSLSVSDTGCGMDAATKAKIFEPFFTTRERGKGTGLGLSVVYGIVQQSGGRIMVESELGRGTVLEIRLPRVAESESPAASTDSEGWHGGSGKILLIEDERAVKELAVRMLTQAGYAVVSPDDGGDALGLSKAELEAIDLVVTDVVMPGMSGPDLAAHLLKRNPELKVLYISGHTDHPLIASGPLSERACLLRKPFTQTELLRKVQKVLDGAHQVEAPRALRAAS